MDRFGELLDEMRRVHDAKASDYGNNLHAAQDFGVPAWVGTMIRANDKMARIQTFARTQSLKNESVKDSLLDLANYTLLAYVLLEETEQEADRLAVRVDELEAQLLHQDG